MHTARGSLVRAVTHRPSRRPSSTAPALGCPRRVCRRGAADSACRITYLAIYLNDHFAGATGGVELARRAARENEGTDLGAFLAGLAVQIAEDRQTLRRVMAAAGVRPQVAKAGAAWLAEKAGRLKLNGQIRGQSPLSPVVELEGLAIGINGKLLLWRMLREHRPPGAAAVDLDELIARAERQLADLETHRIAAGAALNERA